jgi:cobalt/nickel transport system permease protein
MNHSYIDLYSGGNSFLHRMDPRVKIITFFIFILFAVLTEPSAYLSFILYFFILFFLAVISKVPFLFILKRSLAIIPFVVLIAVPIPFIKKDGMVLFRGILMKAYLSLLCMILLTSTTKFTNLLKALEKLKIPGIFIMVMSFMYRYLFLMIDDIQRMRRAKECRVFGKTKKSRIIKTLSLIIGVLFVRSYERAERVYLAMCSRGFDGEIRTLDTLKIRVRDVLFLMITVGALAVIKLIKP